MRRSSEVVVMRSRFAVIGLVFALCGMVGGSRRTDAQTPPQQTPPQQTPPAAAPQPPPTPTYSGDAGLMQVIIKPDKGADFEMVIGKLKEALQKSTKPERKQQASGWKVFKSAAPGPNGNLLYVMIIDPVMKGADYTVSTILYEAWPVESQELFKVYKEAFVGQAPINLTLLTDLGK